MLSLLNCRERQARLVHVMREHRLDVVVLSNPKTIHYLSGALTDPAQPQAFGIRATGESLLVTNAKPEQAAADEVLLYTGYTLDRPFSRATMHQELVAMVARRYRRAGPAALEFDYAGHALGAALDPVGDITPHLQRMRRRKDADEIAAMRECIRITEAAYGAVKARLAPGMTEYQAFNIISEAMVCAAGRSVEVRGDFAAGTRGINGGGPPTDRTLEAGDLYILDLFPLHQGYVCDLCRTFVVGTPSEEQQAVWKHVMAGHDVAAKAMRPGVTGRDVYRAVRDHMESYPKFHGSFSHHAGHGVGMDGWEFPWLTPGSDQPLVEGEVIACEPALYGEELRGGIRLEHNYLVGKSGVTALDSFPMDL